MSIVDHETSEISMRVKLSRKAKEKLTSLAAEHGQGIDEFASELLEQAVTRPNLDELLAPVRADFANSGMSEQEIMELGVANWR